jgi:N-ethylmaleimide reductase
MTVHNILFHPTRMGALELPNRILMAPLTRNRAQADGTPGELAERYYAQRASAGLIFSEATQISPMAKGYIDTPGIYTPEHVAGWKKITSAVHAAGGRIFCQLWHVGRISHVSLLPDNQPPVSSSAVRAEAQTFTENGFEDTSEPVELPLEDIPALIADYRHAAKMAKEAGFDGVEVHGANGYLLDQFLQDGVNRRDDAYGGAPENRMRLLCEVIDAATEVWGADRVGVRLSPLGQANGISDSDPEALFSAVYAMIARKGLAYLHVVESFPGSDGDQSGREMLDRLRAGFEGFYVANGGYDGDSAAEAVAAGRAEAVAIGRDFLANPDLPERLRVGADLNEPDQSTFYGGGAEGYVDYPFLDEDEKTAA